MKSKMKHAVSLIVLVVTILVLAILAAAVIISLSNANIMSQASKTVFKSDMANFKEAYEMYVISELADDVNFDRSTLNVTYESDEFEDIFGANVSDKYKEGLQVVNGKLVYVTEDETEKEILEDLGIASSATETPVTPDTPSNAISKEPNEEGKSPYIGCYVKIGGEYGVIFADMAVGGNNTWSANSVTYSYYAVSDKSTLKDYTISSTKSKPEGSNFGENYVLEVTGDTTGKQDRFYVMALSDITSEETTDNKFTWYDAACDKGISDYSTVTSTDFGTGKANTATMITAWNATTYGAQNDNSSYLDMWGVIQTKVNNGWFVPSREEWGVFASAFDITKSDYSSTYGLSYYYWSSSLLSAFNSWVVLFAEGNMGSRRLNYDGRYVRLAATF